MRIKSGINFIVLIVKNLGIKKMIVNLIRSVFIVVIFLGFLEVFIFKGTCEIKENLIVGQSYSVQESLNGYRCKKWKRKW